MVIHVIVAIMAIINNWEFGTLNILIAHDAEPPPVGPDPVTVTAVVEVTVGQLLSGPNPTFPCTLSNTT